MELKIIVEKHEDGFVAYPIGVRGACIGQGDTFEETLADAASAIRMHIETFGADALEDAQPVEVFVAEARIPA